MMVKDKKSTRAKSERAEKSKRGMGKGFVHIALELLATVLIISLLGLAIFIWRLTTGPFDLSFAKPTIQEALRDEDTGMRVDFDQAVLHWPDLKGPLLLGLSGGQVFNKDNRLVVAIDSAALSLNKAKLLIGRVSPEGLIIRQPSVLLKRSKDNEFSIGLTNGFEGDQGASDEISLDSVFDVFGRPDGNNSGRLSMLKLVRIEGAQVLIDDMVLSRSWQVPRLDVALIREADGLRSQFDVDLPRLAKTPPDIVPNIEGDVFAGWNSEILQIRSVLSRFHVGFLADKIPELSILANHDVRLDAKVDAVLDSAFALKDLQAAVFSPKGALNIAEFSDDALAYQDFNLNASYDGDKNVARVESLSISAKGVSVSAQANAAHRDGGFVQGFDLDGNVKIGAVTHAQIASLWPQALSDDNAKTWIVDKLSGANFSDVYADFGLNAVPDENDALSFDLNKLVAGFDFESLKAQYMSTLSPVENAVGKGSFDYISETLKIDVGAANILDLDIRDTSLVFRNIIQAGKGKADLSINLAGPFQSMVRYLSDEPIGVQIDGDVKDIKGKIDASVALKFPTKDDVLKEEIDIVVTGSVEEAFLPKIVGDAALSGGPYAIDVKDGLFNLSGKGKIEGRDVDLKYSEYLFADNAAFKSKTVAKLNADKGLRDALGVDLSDFLSESAALDVTYVTQNNGSAIADVKADITGSRLYFDPFDYEKSVGQAGEATLKVHLQDGVLQKITNLRATAPALDLGQSTLRFRSVKGKEELSGGNVSTLRIGETNGAIDFEISPLGLLNLSLKGAFLDARPFLNDDGEKDAPYSNPAMRISVNVDTMRTDDDAVLNAANIFADINDQGQFNQVDFNARAGKGPLSVSFKPDQTGTRVFSLEAEDAGATLKAFGIYDDIRGGRLVVNGNPVRGVADRDLSGKAKMSNFKVVKAPALARIIGALSLPGAANMLAGEGLSFSKLESDFNWVFDPDGSLLVLKNGRTSGNAMGLTFEGNFDNAASKIDVQGTIIPLSGVNDIISKIPLVGDILTGGSGGIFAATYTIKGDGKDPSVSVNPLSVLAPGILRRILFEGGGASVPEAAKKDANKTGEAANDNNTKTPRTAPVANE